MAKFNKTAVKPAISSPVVSERNPSGVTYQGGAGYARAAKGELFLLAVSNLVGEDTFYEAAGARDSRYAELVRRVAIEDPQWTAAFLAWLRGEANLRSAALVGAAEAAKGMLAAGLTGSRALVASVLRRADEPGELLAYWTARYGRAIPKPVKRGIADAVTRLYTEYSLLKYDTASKGYRFADVIELVHPTPGADQPGQGDLFRAALERRHHREQVTALPMLAANAALRTAARTDPGVLLDAATLRAAGMTWEDVFSLAGRGASYRRGRDVNGKGVDAGRLWEAVIPSMGYMALLRNLRNFDQAGVSDRVAAEVAARLTDPGQVARSRQLPMRFLSAYRAAPNLRWAYPLEQALRLSLANVPALSGRTLILVDTSGSMNSRFGQDGTLLRWDAAVLFGVALAQRCASATVVSFANGTKVFPLVAGESLLASLQRWQGKGFFLNGGTDTAPSVRAHFARHDRVVVLTDEQASYGDVDSTVPATTPLITFNLAGYRLGHASSGTGTRVTIGGLTDQAFRVIPLLEAGRNADWPWAI
jgi:TROVE domain